VPPDKPPDDRVYPGLDAFAPEHRILNHVEQTRHRQLTNLQGGESILPLWLFVGGHTRREAFP
jgi:hypothetical protein